MATKPILCIYHHNCADGFGAAWAVQYHFGDDQVDFFGGVHGGEPPDVTDRHVLMVDFAYKRPVMERLINQAASILVLDHHESAARDLDFMATPDISPQFMPNHGAMAYFDMERSGAGITWDHFRPNQPRPDLIDHLEDRDLWRFELEGTEEIQATVFSYPYSFPVWNWLMNREIEELRQEGEAIKRKHHKDIDELLEVLTTRMIIGGHEVPMANLPYTMASDAGHKLALDEPFAGVYWDTRTGRTFSLRSRPQGMNVAKIAEQYGGGGHEHAAGFHLEINEALDLIPGTLRVEDIG